MSARGKVAVDAPDTDRSNENRRTRKRIVGNQTSSKVVLPSAQLSSRTSAGVEVRFAFHALKRFSCLIPFQTSIAFYVVA